MHSRLLVALFSSMIFFSAFLSFAYLPPAGSPQTPFGRAWADPVLRSLDLDAILALPPLALAFLGSFLLGLLTTLIALLGWAPRLLALPTAMLPLGTLIYAWFSGRSTVESLGVTLPTGPFGEAMSQLAPLAGWGFWLWLAGAALLLMTALLDPGADD